MSNENIPETTETEVMTDTAMPDAKTAALEALEWEKTFEAEYAKASEADREKTQATPADATKYTIDYALEQLEKIASDPNFISEALQNLSLCHSTNSKEITSTISNAILAHETTNQKLIDFYTGMIADLRKPSPDELKQRHNALIDSIYYICYKTGKHFPDFETIWKYINS